MMRLYIRQSGPMKIIRLCKLSWTPFFTSATFHKWDWIQAMFCCYRICFVPFCSVVHCLFVQFVNLLFCNWLCILPDAARVLVIMYILYESMFRNHAGITTQLLHTCNQLHIRTLYVPWVVIIIVVHSRDDKEVGMANEVKSPENQPHFSQTTMG